MKEREIIAFVAFYPPLFYAHVHFTREAPLFK